MRAVLAIILIGSLADVAGAAKYTLRKNELPEQVAYCSVRYYEAVRDDIACNWHHSIDEACADALTHKIDARSVISSQRVGACGGHEVIKVVYKGTLTVTLNSLTANGAVHPVSFGVVRLSTAVCTNAVSDPAGPEARCEITSPQGDVRTLARGEAFKMRGAGEITLRCLPRAPGVNVKCSVWLAY